VDKDQLIKRLMETFCEELAEHVGALNRDLLVLEKDDDPVQRAERLQTLFRTAHSLKGAARSVNIHLIESVCHQLEEILAVARDGARRFASEHFSLLYATADAIEDAGRRLREQQELFDAPLAALLPQLELAASRVAETLQTDSATDGAASLARSAAPEPHAEQLSQVFTGYSTAKAAEESLGPAQIPTSVRTELSTTQAVSSPGEASSVRVAAEKLDALLARDGELLVARRRAGARLSELQALRDSAAHWAAEWRAVEGTLRKWLAKTNSSSTGAATRTRLAEQRVANPLPRRVAAVLGQAANKLRRLDKELDRLTATMTADHRLLEQSADALAEELRRVRMIPFTECCQGLDRMVRDLASTTGKDVALTIDGGSVELDRTVLDALKDPLRHLVRNAVDHGVETPPQREATGKPPRARVTVRAVLRGSRVEVEVADDGQGIDLSALRETLRNKGMQQAKDEEALLRALFLPGVSTSRFITDVSGRGVGLDVVRSRVESLHGTVNVRFSPGQGTRFTLAVPLTLTALRAVLVETGGQTFALAGTNVEKLVRIGTADLVCVAGREMLATGEAPLPIVSLAETLGLRTREAKSKPGKRPAVVVAAGDNRIAFLVDELIAEQEILIKHLGNRIRRLRYVSGATILPSGRVALVLNAGSLLRGAASQAPASSITVNRESGPPARKRIVVADDSLTTRTLEKSIIEAAGYDVTVAADGDAAWQILQEHGADLLISDVEMPRMDGFALVEAIRGSERFRRLPIVLVTARGSEHDKERGLKAGADAYLVKSSFDQKNLLETIGQLL
jgi:two-component system chemotaxis sensor kinase CheA